MRAIADDENLASDETLVTIADVIRQIVRVSTDRYNEVDAVLSQLYAGRREREGGNT